MEWRPGANDNCPNQGSDTTFSAHCPFEQVDNHIPILKIKKEGRSPRSRCCTTNFAYLASARNAPTEGIVMIVNNDPTRTSNTPDWQPANGCRRPPPE